MGDRPLFFRLLFFALLITGAVLGLAHLSPGVNFGDSGELAASAATLSVPHAPGYPLFCLLGKALGTLIPLGNWAYRTNLLSLVCAFGTLALLLRAAAEVGLSALGGWTSVLCFAASPLWLHQSLVTEVFALNALFGAAGLWAVCRYRERVSEPKPLALLGLLLGLGLGNHHLLLFAAAGIALGLPRAFWSSLDGRRLVLFAAFFLLGFSVYLYHPLRSAHLPPLDWGHPTSLSRFLRVLTRRDYGSFSLTVEGAASTGFLGRLGQVGRYLSETYRGLGAAGLLLSLAGLALWPRLGLKASWRLPTAFVLLTGPVFLMVGNPPSDPLTLGALKRFYPLGWMGLSLLAGAACETIERKWRRAGWGAAAPGWAVLLVLAAWGARGRPAWALRWDLAAYDYGRNILKTLPPGSALFMDGGDDTFYALAFLQFAQKMRPDLELRDRGGLVFRNPYGADFRKLAKPDKEARRLEVEAAAARHKPLYYSTMAEKILPGHDLVPAGLLQESRLGMGSKGGRKGTKGLAAWEFYPLRHSREILAHHYRDRALVPLYPYMKALALRRSGDLRGALRELQAASDLGPDVAWLSTNNVLQLSWLGYEASQKGDWRLARDIYAGLLAEAPGQADGWLNLGVALEKTGDPDAAEAHYRRALELDPSLLQGYLNLTAVYWHRGDFRKVLDVLEAALKRHPGHPQLRSYWLRAQKQLE